LATYRFFAVFQMGQVKKRLLSTMLSKLRQLLRQNLFLRKLAGYHLASSGLFDNYFKNYQLSTEWKKRLQLILDSSDTAHIEKVPGAGIIRKGKQVMHNGLNIYLGSYYGPEYSVVLQSSKGVHEPQEERVFQEVLKQIPANATMLELGAFWGFYSMWFNQSVKGAENFLVEPDSFNLGQGKRNFKLNSMKGNFIQAFVGEKSTGDGDTKTLCVDDIIEQNGIDFLDMLHSDIQGYEYDMLKGATKLFDAKKVGYVFISTHSNEVHYKCLEFLKVRQFEVIASADLDETYSEDGLIAARAPYYPGIAPLDISKRTKA
jgi:hypothetical protein